MVINFKSAAILGAALSTVLVAGCSDNGASSPTPAPTGGTPGVTQLAFVTNGPSDYWIICRKGTEAAERDIPGVNVSFVMPDDSSAATQTRDVDDLLAKGASGIAISPVDPANETAFLDGVATKTNLITSDSDAPGTKRLCYIGTDNHAAGEMAGGLIKQALPLGGKIMLFVGKRDAQNAKEREQGIRDSLAGTNVSIIDVRTDDVDHARAKANAADALVKYPDIAGMVGLWSYNGPAILSAVKDAGKVGKVKIVAFDQEDDTIAGIKSGAIFGTVVQQPYKFGYESIKLLDELSKGDKSALPASQMMIIPTQAVTTSNVDAYVADQEKLLGKS
jgi:ribose transport system substrate-binding protein